MNRLGINFTADLAEAVADLPATLTVGSRQYSVIADAERRSLDVVEPGRYAVYDRTVTIPLSAIKAVPALQSTVTLDAIAYWVADVSRDRETDTLAITLRREDGG